MEGGHRQADQSCYLRYHQVQLKDVSDMVKEVLNNKLSRVYRIITRLE